MSDNENLEQGLEAQVDDFDAAFNDAVADLEQDGFEEDTATSTDDAQDTGDDSLDDDDQQDLTEDSTTAQGVVEGPDYRILYEQVSDKRRQTEAELAQTKAEYLSWRGRMEALEQQVHGGTSKKAEAKPEVDAELQEFFELFPETAGPVQKLIEKHVTERVGAVEQKIEQLYETGVRPLADRVKESEVQAQEAAILRVHPDMHQRVATGEFRQWVNTLPPYQQVGIQHIVLNGAANDLIDLFSEFKRATSQTFAPQHTSTEKTSRPSLASKVVDALGVSSEPSRVDILQSNAEPSDPAKLFDKFAKEIMTEGM